IERLGTQRLAHATLRLPVTRDRSLNIPLARTELAAQLVRVARGQGCSEALDARGGSPRPVAFPGVMTPRERCPGTDKEQVQRKGNQQNPAGPPAGTRRRRRGYAHGCASGNGSGANTTAPMSLSATIDAASSPLPSVVGPRSVNPRANPSTATP